MLLKNLANSSYEVSDPHTGDQVSDSKENTFILWDAKFFSERGPITAWEEFVEVYPPWNNPDFVPC